MCVLKKFYAFVGISKQGQYYTMPFYLVSVQQSLFMHKVQFTQMLLFLLPKSS